MWMVLLIQVSYVTFTLFDAGIRVLLEDGIGARSFAGVLLLEYFHSSLEVLLGNLVWWMEFELFFLVFNWNLTMSLYFGMIFFSYLGCFIL